MRELGIGSDYYGEIFVNDVKIDGIDVTPVDGIYPCSVDTIIHRARVGYSNYLAETNNNDLYITKQLGEGCEDTGETFEFRVMLENVAGSTGPNTEGALVPYSVGPYYLQNENGEYFRYVGGVLTNNGMTPIVASVSGQNGTIAGVPAGYTVSIRGLLAGTDFFVEEIRNPEGWLFVSKTLVEEARVYGYDPSTLQGVGWSGGAVTADGQIALGLDAKVVIVNDRPQDKVPIRVEKDWTGTWPEGITALFRLERITEDAPMPNDMDRVDVELLSPGGVDQKQTFLLAELTFRAGDELGGENGSGVYRYRVREISHSTPGHEIAWDQNVYVVTIAVTREGDDITASIQSIQPEEG